MTQEQEFEFRYRLEKERAAAEAAGPATGSTNTGRSKDIKFQSATDILKDAAVGGLRSATNVGTHLVDAALTLPKVANKVTGLVAPGLAEKQRGVIQDIEKAGQEGREFWQKRYEEAGPTAAVGGVVTDALASGGVTRPAARVAASVLPKVKNTLNRATLTGGLAGAAGGGLTSDDPGTGAGVGGVVGLAIPRVINRIVKGLPKSQSAKALETELDEPLSVGQASPRTPAGLTRSSIETGGRFVPFGGQSIENFQQRAVQAWRRAALRRGNIPDTPAGGKGVEIPRMGPEDNPLALIEQQKAELAAREAKALAGSKFFPDEELERKILSISNDPDRLIDEQGAKTLQKAYERTLMKRIRGGAPAPSGSQLIVPGGRTLPPNYPPSHWTGEDVQRARDVISKAGRKMKATGGSDPFRQGTGQALVDISDEILEMMHRQNPAVGETLKLLRDPQQSLKVLRGAAKKSPGLGNFTPDALTKSAERAGHENLETLGRHGSEVFRNTETGLRQSSAAGVRGIGRYAAVIGHLMEPTTAALTLGPVAAYQRPVQRFALGDTKAQKALADYIRKIGATDILGE